MWTAAYWKDLSERVLATFAGSLVTLWGAGGLNLLHVDWRLDLGIAGATALVALVKGLAAKSVGDPSSAALLLSGGGRHELR